MMASAVSWLCTSVISCPTSSETPACICAAMASVLPGSPSSPGYSKGKANNKQTTKQKQNTTKQMAGFRPDFGTARLECV